MVVGVSTRLFNVAVEMCNGYLRGRGNSCILESVCLEEAKNWEMPYIIISRDSHGCLPVLPFHGVHTSVPVKLANPRLAGAHRVEVS